MPVAVVAEGWPTRETITKFCKKKWPTDFTMQKFCIEKQRNGAGETVDFYDRYDTHKSSEVYILSEPAMTISQHCKESWPDDFEMRAYCLNKQEEAAKSIDELE